MKNLIRLSDGFNTVVDASQVKNAQCTYVDGCHYRYQIKITFDDNSKVTAAFEYRSDRDHAYEKLLAVAGAEPAPEPKSCEFRIPQI